MLFAVQDWKFACLIACLLASFTAIFVLKIQRFCLYFPEASFNTTKTGFQMKGMVVRNNLVFILSQLVISFQSYNYFKIH